MAVIDSRNMPRKPKAVLPAPALNAGPVKRRGRQPGWSPKNNNPLTPTTESAKQLCTRINEAVGMLFTKVTNDTANSIPVLREQIPIQRALLDSLEKLTQGLGTHQAMRAGA